MKVACPGRLYIQVVRPGAQGGQMGGAIMTMAAATNWAEPCQQALTLNTSNLTLPPPLPTPPPHSLRYLHAICTPGASISGAESCQQALTNTTAAAITAATTTVTSVSVLQHPAHPLHATSTSLSLCVSSFFTCMAKE